MGQVRVLTDSGADLTAEMAGRLQIGVVPLVVLFGNQVYLDGELSTDEFWEKVDGGELHPGTSQPAMGAFEKAYARLVEAGHQVLCLTITSKHSGTFSTASSAARPFGEKVKVFDSWSLSLGQGFQVLGAARAAMEGLDLEQVAKVVEGIRARTHLYILLDSVEFIRRGGRAALLMPLLTRVTDVLRIRPILNVVEGRLGLHRIARSYERGLANIREEMAQLRPLESLAVVHTRCAETAREMARSLAEALDFPLKEILVTETGPLLSVHAGRGVIGVVAVQQAT
jgi:DegV family protein with EDD domain